MFLINNTQFLYSYYVDDCLFEHGPGLKPPIPHSTTARDLKREKKSIKKQNNTREKTKVRI